MNSNSRRGFANVSKLRRKLRKMPDEITKGVKTEIELAAKVTERSMLGMVPVDEGDLASVIKYKLGRDGMSAVIGPGAASAQFKRGMGMSEQKFKKDGSLTLATQRNNFTRFQMYKAHWLENGTAKMGRRPFIEPAWDLNKDKFRRSVRAAVADALEVAADG